MGQRHSRLARRFLPDSDIRVLVRNKEKPVPEEANGLFTSLADALAFSPELAVIASPAPLHLDSALPLARLGTHLLMEKPIAAVAEGVQALIDVVRTHRGVLLLGYNLRFAPSLREFRRLVQAGAIGRCYAVRAEVGQYLPSWRPDADYRQGVSACKVLGGGVLLELSHEFDYLRWIFGEVTSVQATLARQSRLEIDVEDTADLMLAFAAAGGKAPVLASVHLDFVRQDTVRTCTVVGEGGTLRWNALAGEVDLYTPEAGQWLNVFTEKPQRDATYIAEWEHLLDCVEQGNQPLITGDDGLAILNIVEQAHQSAVTGCRVTTLLN